MRYVHIIEQANDGSYSAFVPDLPGCTTSGDTVDEVRVNIKDVVALHIEFAIPIGRALARLSSAVAC